MPIDDSLIRRLADLVGTPFWIYDDARLHSRIADIKAMTAAPGLQARFAMKACPATAILREMAAHDIWIDAVSGNEALRAIHAGHQPGQNPPVICFTADVFRDNALEVVLRHDLLPNIGSPGMIRQLTTAGYRGPISIRVNPGCSQFPTKRCSPPRGP